MTVPITNIEQMKAIDANAAVPVAELIDRVGAAVGRYALLLLGGAYGRRVVVVAGKGNNGNDGRAAAQWLRSKGIVVKVVDVSELPSSIRHCDLVIDAAFGTGFRGEFKAPDVSNIPVLAIDIPSGLNADTGVAQGAPFKADLTVAIAAFKPGMLINEGPDLCGSIVLADIGLDVETTDVGLVTDDDVADWLPVHSRNSNKWEAAVLTVAGSPGMLGAAELSANASMRAGAGMVRLFVPGADALSLPANEVVSQSLASDDWVVAIEDDAKRCSAGVIGPGLGRAKDHLDRIRSLVESFERPLVIDGDGLFALGEIDSAKSLIAKRKAPTVLTPHDGEFARLAGHKPRADRIKDVQDLAEQLNATVLLKGSTTVIANPNGQTLINMTGDARLATAGTGDVLSGIIATMLARGLTPIRAAATGAFVHGLAARQSPEVGMIASDLLMQIPLAIEQLSNV